MVLTVGEFAKAYHISTNDVIDLARTMGFSLKGNHCELSDELKKKLQISLAGTTQGMSLGPEVTILDLKDGHSRIPVVTKKVKKVNLDALKAKMKEHQKETQQEEQLAVESEDTLEQEELMTVQEVVQDKKIETQAGSLGSEIQEKTIKEPSLFEMNESFVVEKQDLTPASADSIEKQDRLEKTEKEKKALGPVQDDDLPARSGSKKSKKKSKSGGDVIFDSSKLDNNLLKKMSSHFQQTDGDSAYGSNWKKKSRKDKKADHQFSKPTKPVKLTVGLPEKITATDLAKLLSVKVVSVLKELMKLGYIGQASYVIDRDTAILIVEELGHTAVHLNERTPESHLDIAYSGLARSRPPVVTIMGHVDHGKTSLLDYIRRSRVAASEAGGITQHIGAYCVNTDHGSVTFLDTPGHAAFTAMRARGSKCTDIAIILVAADDGVMPQTKEAIAHAKAANLPIVVAVNKMDKEGVDPERIKTQMAQLDVLPEEWGGDSPFIPISAKTGNGISDLIEAILLQAEVLELKSYYEGSAQGVIIESSLSRLKGPVATVLVQNGTLKVGDLVVCGTEFGRVKALSNDLGAAVVQATPSMPVEILGLSGVVQAGDKLTVVENEKQARDVVEHRQVLLKPVHEQAAVLSLDSFLSQSQKVKELGLILKADTHGSVEAIAASIKKLSNTDVSVKLIAQGVGGITESDVMLAKASSALILGFNTRADKNAKDAAEKEGVKVYYYSIIYELLDNIKAAITGLAGPKFQEEIVGLAQVRSVFRSSVLGQIAGCLVIEGTVRKDLPIRVLRDNIVIYQGKLESLRRFKDDVQDVRSGTECGIGVKDYNDVREGDQIEVYRMIEVQRTSE